MTTKTKNTLQDTLHCEVQGGSLGPRVNLEGYFVALRHSKGGRGQGTQTKMKNLGMLKKLIVKKKKSLSETSRDKELKSYMKQLYSRIEKTNKKHPWELPHPGY